MTNEQRKAIEICKEKIIEPFYDFPNPTSIELKDTDVEAIETVLSLIKEQEIEIEKKDKIINEMIEEYEYNDGINTKKFCDEEIRKDKCIENCTICMQQYFAGLVEKE